MSEETRNEEQRTYWNDQAGASWVKFQDMLDTMLNPLGQAALDALLPVAGENALDIGCGCGHTTLELAKRVAPGGQVTGIDLSAPMLARARERANENNIDNAHFQETDAQTSPFTAASFDIAYSRFGVMFFDNPVAAFTNLRKALRKNGRMSFVCWRSVAENPWIMTTIAAAMEHVTFDPPVPGAPGPFAFADADRVRSILQKAGFANISIEEFTTDMTLGAGASVDETLAFLVRLGPIGRKIASGEIDDATLAKITESVRAGLTPFITDNGVVIGGSTWVVTARAA
ncbi:MAG: SAM-dependent methyltransferase [Hyphomicrobiaceae bacterium]|jgi:SAM-dependent methyltransferase